jgi:cytochrome P450
MERYAALIVQRAVEMSAEWSATAPIDIAAEMHRLTLAVASKALFGEDLDEESTSELHEAIRSIASDDPLVSLLAPARRRRDAERFLRSFVTGIVDRRRQTDAAHDDLLALLMAQPPTGSGTVTQLYDDVLTMLLAGHDTIANALTWTWILLAQHAGMEERLHGELAEVLHGGLPDSGVIERLKFTRAVLAESLRLFPPAALLTRIAYDDFALDTATIPSGSLVVMSQYLVHRDARFFADPLKFNPDRWLSPAEQLPLAKLAYFPFGAGPRGCVGEGFAWLEGILVLAVIAKRWRVRPVATDAIEAETRVTLRPKSPVWSGVKSRDQ